MATQSARYVLLTSACAVALCAMGCGIQCGGRPADVPVMPPIATESEQAPSFPVSFRQYAGLLRSKGRSIVNPPDESPDEVATSIQVPEPPKQITYMNCTIRRSWVVPFPMVTVKREMQVTLHMRHGMKHELGILLPNDQYSTLDLFEDPLGLCDAESASESIGLMHDMSNAIECNFVVAQEFIEIIVNGSTVHCGYGNYTTIMKVK
jgi:hypothetical protein